MTDLQCPICADDMSLASTATSSRALGLNCCGQMMCQDCLYRHLRSCFEEGLTGQGRSTLACPFGCGHTLSDKVVRATIDRKYVSQQWIWKLVGKFGLYLTQMLGMDDRLGEASYRIWYYWSHTSGAKRDLERYEQWSLAVALRKQPTMNCPMPGCEYQWITNPLYRKHKQAHEAKRSILWYSPPSPDKTGNFDWAEPEFVNVGANGNFIEPDLTDGRRMVCAQCLCAFCGLCRRPWETGGRKSHRGITCAKYTRIMPYDQDYAFVASLTDTRCCPGCSLRTQRTEGCNHMTCPCGFEWCYVCEQRWHRIHYQCTDRQGRNYIQDGNAACAIM
jgi:hypothetical protein